MRRMAISQDNGDVDECASTGKWLWPSLKRENEKSLFKSKFLYFLIENSCKIMLKIINREVFRHT